MPFQGVNAVEHMGLLLDRIHRDLQPRLAARTTAMPVVPPGARHATLNINGISGGQPVDGIQTPCVADRCRAVFDRRFLLEEGFDATKAEIVALLDGLARDVPDFKYELRDLMVVHPTQTPDGSPVVAALDRALHRVLGRSGGLVASPGTYDHKHFARIAGVPHCVAYGPGILDLAHQPDEYVRHSGSDERHEGHRAGGPGADGHRVAAPPLNADNYRRTSHTDGRNAHGHDTHAMGHPVQPGRPGDGPAALRSSRRRPAASPASSPIDPPPSCRASRWKRRTPRPARCATP